MILHLGVVDIPYSGAPSRHRRKGNVASGTQTTGDVAGWLEDKYHVMEHFYEQRQDVVVAAVEDSVQGAVESLLMGASFKIDPFGSATSKIEGEFREFLSSREIESVGYPGVPTKAAQRGVNHRLRHPYRRANPRRPSFVDTALYQASFRAWVS